MNRKDLIILQKDRIITNFPYLLDLYKKFQLSAYINGYRSSIEDNIVCVSFDYAYSMQDYYSNKCPRVWSLVAKIVDSNYHKRLRVSTRFENMFLTSEFPIYFGTLTFTDEVLENTSNFTRRVYVRRFLKNISSDYLANIDFGDLNNREHFHCLFSCDNIDKFKLWKYGFVNVKKVVFSKSNKHNISNYIVKLVNHCVKGSAGYLISSRNKK